MLHVVNHFYLHIKLISQTKNDVSFLVIIVNHISWSYALRHRVTVKKSPQSYKLRYIR